MVATANAYIPIISRRHRNMGKRPFLTRLAREIARIKDPFPEAHYVGIADGAVLCVQTL